MFKYNRLSLPISLFYIHGSLLAIEERTQDQLEPACHSTQHIVYQGYDQKSGFPLKLSFDPVHAGLCFQESLQKAVSGDSSPNLFISLPEPVASIDAVTANEQQIIVAGKDLRNTSFLQAVDKTGNLLWRYPPSVEAASHLRIYDLALSKTKTELFVAGSKNHQSLLWHLSLSGSAISQPEDIPGFNNSETTDSYRQVITVSGNEVIVVRHPDQSEQPTQLEKWYRQDGHWYQIPDFCPEVSLTAVLSVALKPELSGNHFFLIASTAEHIHFFQINKHSGEILDQVRLVASSTLLQWNNTIRITTPVLLSASSALRQESPPAFVKEQLARLGSDLADRPVLILMNRGCLLGISGTSNQNTPLVINLCARMEQEADKQRATNNEPIPPSRLFLSHWFVIKSMLMASGVLALPVFCIKSIQLLRYISSRQPNSPGENPKQQLRRKRLEYLAKNPSTIQPPDQPASKHCVFNPSQGSSQELILQDVRLQNVQTWSDTEREQLLQLLLLAVKKDDKEQPVSKNTITHNMLTKALATVMASKANQSEGFESNKLPDGLILRPMPADQFCFYHAIGRAINVSGPKLFNAIVHQAQELLRHSPTLSEAINNMSGGDILNELAAMAHVDMADLQIWGHQEMLPFICWMLELRVVVVTPATWNNETGGLLFMPDGQWEMLNGNRESMLSQLRELKSAWPDLLIIQHNGRNHWDVLEWPGQRIELNILFDN